MSIKTIRISDDLDKAMEYVARLEKLEKSQSLRKLAGLGFEVYVARLYQAGRLSLRESAKLLKKNLSETLGLFQELGVTGSTGTRDVLGSLDSLSR